ncbi:MFS transporter [Paracoccus litorisediminis]|uniref:MFS transporter n=1 Tax=Paracoccus litorisediminis TaxID=2006130 RepID=A0A844HTW5_9RHOB|nr:MFS transporter [Paracoccus litorisediminis]MTH61777.1 MFS transporter [Paracoccus litorisediminis]
MALTTHVPTAAHRRKALIASLIGSSIEWFDYFLYGTAAALVFNKLYFASEDPTMALLLSYLSFSLTFFIRPIGGVIFAHIGDRIGRKKTLVITLSLMGTATVGIGLLPTYDMIGIWAPILLVGLRIIQGLGIGGEWGGALLLAYEYAPDNRKGFFGSVPQMGAPIGMLLATLSITSILVLLPEESFLSWGWRLPFLLSATLVFLGLWIRSGIDETPEFREAKATGKVSRMPLTETLTTQWREVLIAAGLKVVETAPFYIFTTFIVSYAVTNLGFARESILTAVMMGAAVSSVMIPIMGFVGDLIGRRLLYVLGTLSMGLFAFPYFHMVNSGSTASLSLATVIIFGLMWSPITAVLGTLCSEIFATKVRYTGITLGYQIGAALAGGTAPLIATWLIGRYDTWQPVAIYIMLLAVISLASAFAIRKRTVHIGGKFAEAAE